MIDTSTSRGVLLVSISRAQIRVELSIETGITFDDMSSCLEDRNRWYRRWVGVVVVHDSVCAIAHRDLRPMNWLQPLFYEE